MSFKIVDTFKWPVTFEYAADGKFKKQSFKAEFKRIPTEEFAELLVHDEEDQAGRVNMMTKLLKVVLVSVEQVEGDGSDEEIMASLISDTTVGNAMLESYTEAMTGGRRGKNLK